MKGIINIIFSRDAMLKHDSSHLCRSRMVVSLVLGISAAFMLVMNIMSNATTMVYSSIVLLVGFLLSAFFAGVLKKERISAVIIAGLVAFVLSGFALSGGNEGFAILWILLVPLFAINILGVIEGFLLSTYFLFFLLILFYTGLNGYIDGKYTSAFISRFPILYMADYMIATFFSLQREYYQRKMKMQIYSDGLTGAYNRRYCMERLKQIGADDTDYAIIALDINGLKAANDTIGHEAGDEMLCAVIECCNIAFDKNDAVCRTGGDEYIVIAHGDEKSVADKIDKLKHCRDKWKGKIVKKLSFAVGCAYAQEGMTYSDLLKKADREMYSDKMLYYQDENNNRRNKDNR